MLGTDNVCGVLMPEQFSQKCRLKIPQLIVPPPRGEPWGETANRPPNPALARQTERCGDQTWGSRHDFDLHRQGLTVSVSLKII